MANVDAGDPVIIDTSDPSRVSTPGYVGEFVPNTQAGLTVSSTITNTMEATLATEITHEGNSIVEMVAVTPGLAATDANSSPYISDPSLSQEDNHDDEMVIPTAVEEIQNPNDNPSIDDPSKIEGDDYIGEMVIIVPSQESNGIVAYDGNAVAPAVTPDEAIEVVEYDAIGEMVIIAEQTTSISTPPSAIDENAVRRTPQSNSFIFLPLVNN